MTTDDERATGRDTGDEACRLATDESATAELGHLVAVHATAVSMYLLHWGGELGFRTTLVEADAQRIGAGHRRAADRIVTSIEEATPGDDADVVVTDHDAPDLADHLAAALRTRVRSIGLMGSQRHAPPHVEPLRGRGFDEAEIARIQRPIGLDIGSRTPPEIALATLAGLVADQRDRTGGRYGPGPRH